MKLSPKTIEILQGIMNSTEGWHRAFDLKEADMKTFWKEVPQTYILEVTLDEEYDDKEENSYYIVLGTDWYDAFGQLIPELKNDGFLICPECGKYAAEFDESESGMDICTECLSGERSGNNEGYCHYCGDDQWDPSIIQLPNGSRYNCCDRCLKDYELNPYLIEE